MSDISENLSLPPGWDTKYDFKTGKRYYINHFTKHTSLEDPRMKYIKLQAGESLTFQSYQSSPIRSFSPQPFYHIHQDLNFSSGRPSPIMGRSYSPLMGSNAIHYLAQKPHEYPTLETSVSKIKSLFPTVSETHIKALLHKYHFREAVVVSALQVEKHPLTTPGPYSSPLSAARHVISQIAPSAPGSPGRFSFSSAFRNLSPRRTPHSSPKMKLRYLKSVFPVVEETVLLDTLCSSENNVHKATETLMTMGFMKKDSLTYKQNLKKNEEGSYSSEKELKNDAIFISLHDTTPKLRTPEEKEKIKKALEEKFEKIAEQIITLALETADYDEERAEQFLNATLVEDKKKKEKNYDLPIKEKPNNESDSEESKKGDEKPFRDSGIWEKASPVSIENKSTTKVSPSSEDIQVIENFRKSMEKIKEMAPHHLSSSSVKETCSLNAMKSKTGIKLCTKLIPRGPNKTLLGSRCTAKGPNGDLPKGPNKSFMKNFSSKKSNKTQPPNQDLKGECSLL